MISLIITAFQEPQTLEKQIKTILYQNSKISTPWEMFIAAPDQETQGVVLRYYQRNPSVKLIKDQGRGKPAALNLAFQKVKGDILILTDGDVLVDDQAILALLAPFKNPKIGAVSGRPRPQNPRENKFSFWAYVLTEMAHKIRLARAKRGEYIDASGYLYAIRNKLISKIPENTLADDALISSLIYAKGFQIAYAPQARVWVKYPDHFADWLKQKKRSTGGSVQIDTILKNLKLKPPPKMRGLGQEVKQIGEIFKHARSSKEWWWTLGLIFARMILWFLIFWEIKIIKKPFRQLWQRVESTK